MESFYFIIILFILFIAIFEEEKKKRYIVSGNDTVKNILKDSVGKDCEIRFNIHMFGRGKCKGEIIEVSDRLVEILVKSKTGTVTKIINMDYIERVSI